jgi:hypothetical protein
MSDSNTTPHTTVEPAHELHYWSQALRGTFGPVHENDPQSGYWRTRPDKEGRSSAVAIWREAGAVHAIRDGRPVDPCEVWTWCCQWPIAYALYHSVVELGEAWPDAIPAIGHNSRDIVPITVGRDVVPSGTDPQAQLTADTMAAEIAELWQHARAWLTSVGTIVTQEVADRAANLAVRFAQLAADAELHRARLKKPVLQHAASIDQLWKPVVERAEKAKAAMKAAVEPYLQGEWDRIQIGGPGTSVDPPSAGTYGRRVSLRSESHVEVRNPKTLVRHYAGDGRFHGDPQVQKVTQKLAQGDLSSGKAVPGAKLISTRRVV